MNNSISDPCEECAEMGEKIMCKMQGLSKKCKMKSDKNKMIDVLNKHHGRGMMHDCISELLDIFNEMVGDDRKMGSIEGEKWADGYNLRGEEIREKIKECMNE